MKFDYLVLNVNRFTVQQQGTSSMMTPNSELHIMVQFKHPSPRVGRYSATIDLTFERLAPPKRFIITRSATAVIADSTDHEAIAPSAPYQPRPRQGQRAPIRGIVWGDRSGRFQRNPYTISIAPYKIPHALIQALEHGSQDVGDILMRLPKDYKFGNISLVNYAQAMSVQLWMEEHKAV
jgi:hypothetical protein